jgi:type II secretory pathway pseudopilin PulG
MRLAPWDRPELRQQSRQGFTLVELMAIVTLLTFLVVLGLPMLVRASQKSKAATCRSNLRQIGFALQTYSDANGGDLPGPLVPLVCSAYDQSSTNQLLWFVAERWGYPAPAPAARLIPGLLCPAHEGESPLAARTDYTLNEGAGLGVPPFGRSLPDRIAPLNLSFIRAKTTPSSCWAVADADKGNVNPTLPKWSALSYEPAHGKLRNRLCFDWHVESKSW